MFGLMAEDAFEEISSIIISIKELSQSKSESMWHLTNSKLKSALDLESLGEFSHSEADGYSVPSSDEWEKVRIIYRLVEHAYYAAKLIFEVKTSTANNVLHNIQEVRENLLLEANISDAFTCKVANNILKRQDKYIRKNYLVLAIASVVDPHCKMQYIDSISTKLEGIDGIPRPSVVLESLRKIYEHHSSQDIVKDVSEHSLDSKSKEDDQFVQANEQPRKSDLDLYLEEPVLPREENFKVLKWWKSECTKYPNVSKVACEILAIPLSVATSYEAYYYLENRQPDHSIITCGAQLMNAVMCGRSWRLWKPVPAIDLELFFLAAGFLWRKS